jgi:hypothetical protein
VHRHRDRLAGPPELGGGRARYGKRGGGEITQSDHILSKPSKDDYSCSNLAEWITRGGLTPCDVNRRLLFSFAVGVALLWHASRERAAGVLR